MHSGWIHAGVLTTVFGLAATLPSCGGDDESNGPNGGSGGGSAGTRAGSGGTAAGRGGSGGGPAAGTGGSATESVTCGDVVCTATSTGIGPTLPACCFDAPSGRCGVDTALLAGFGVMPSRPCEPLDQPGEPDQSCPNSEPVMFGTTMLPAFQGCCREETGDCGYLIDKVGGLVPIGLGCVDSTPFLDGATPPRCGEGSGGAASGGAGGGSSAGDGGAG